MPMSAFSGRYPSFWLLLLCISLLLDVALAAEYRVDDAASGITYSSGWKQGAGCTDCFARPNKNNAYGGTWHDSTRGSGAANYFEYTFTGDAVSVYGIFINIVARNYTFTTNVDLALSIDGQLADTFKHQPEDTNSYAYNQLTVSVNGLAARPHTLRVELQPSSNFLFDYLVYNTPDVTGSTSSSSSSTPSSSSSSTSSSTTSSSTSTSTSTSRRTSLSTLGPVTLSEDSVTTPLATQANSNSDTQTTTTKSSNLGVIIGSVIGGFGALLLLLFLIFYICFRRKQRQIQQQLEQNRKEAHDPNPVFDGSQSQPLVSMTGFGPSYNSNGMTGYYNSGINGGQADDIPNPFVPGNGTVLVPPPPSTIGRLGENGVDYSNLNSKQRMMLDHTQPYTSPQQPTYPPQPSRQSNIPIWVRNLADDGDMSSHTGPLSDDSSPGGLRSFFPSRMRRQSNGGSGRGPRTTSASETSGYLDTESDSASNANSRAAYSGVIGRSSTEKGYTTSISSPSNQGHTVPLQHLSFHPLQNHPYANPNSYGPFESTVSSNMTNAGALANNPSQAFAQLVEQKERRAREEQEAVDELAFIHSAGTNEDSHRLSMGTTAYAYTDSGLVDRRAPSAPPPYIRSPPLPDVPVPSGDVNVLHGGLPPVPPLREKAGWV